VTKSTQAYIAAVIAAGVVTIASAVLDWRSPSSIGLACSPLNDRRCLTAGSPDFPLKVAALA
jgi:hypothetical protein